jgi:DNA-3-methyladenine glycosylase
VASRASSVQAFFDRPVEEVAPRLLGSTIACGGVRLRLTEVEAYKGMTDAASHSYRGPTLRNEVMFGPAGRAYVYFIYGMHWAVNLVCEGEGDAAAVLLRGAEVVSGVPIARDRRGEVTDRQLARGPGNLARAIGATGAMTGTTLWSGPIGWSPAAGPSTDHVVERGPRVGVSQAADIPLRFWIKGDPTVSPYRRSKRA